VRKHVSAFANSIGGFFIVGASRAGKTGSWQIDPVEFGGDEPGPWFSKVIRNNLSPVPRYDVKEWTQDEKRVAVVNVDPVAEPPCMTGSGDVFIRVSGESVKVVDPSVLGGLFERGRARTLGAEAEALRATDLTEAEFLFAFEDPSFLRLRVALAPTGRAEDIAARLFSEPFGDALLAAAAQLPREPLIPYNGPSDFLFEPKQDALTVREYHAAVNPQRWALRAGWDGSVAAYLDVIPETSGEGSVPASDVFAEAVRPAVEAATELADKLGGYGRAHVALRLFARSFRLTSARGRPAGRVRAELIPGPEGLRPLQAWTDSDGRLADDQYDRMERELLRACGLLVWEPETG
jgi:hypothetical protein